MTASIDCLGVRAAQLRAGRADDERAAVARATAPVGGHDAARTTDQPTRSASRVSSSTVLAHAARLRRVAGHLLRYAQAIERAHATLRELRLDDPALAALDAQMAALESGADGQSAGDHA